MLQLPTGAARAVALVSLSIFFIVAGANHFANPDFYVAIMPPYLPAHLGSVYVSGAFEVAGGVGVILPKTRSRAGWMLVALLIAVFPANLHMALHPTLFPEISARALYARLPLQGVLVLWAHWASRPTVPTAPETTAA